MYQAAGCSRSGTGNQVSLAQMIIKWVEMAKFYKNENMKYTRAGWVFSLYKRRGVTVSSTAQMAYKETLKVFRETANK